MSLSGYFYQNQSKVFDLLKFAYLTLVYKQ